MCQGRTKFRLLMTVIERGAGGCAVAMGLFLGLLTIGNDLVAIKSKVNSFDRVVVNMLDLLYSIFCFILN